MFYFYLLQSIKKAEEIYTGSTINLKVRFNEHNQGEVFSTKRYLPWKLIYYEAYLSEKDARLREQKFKRHGKGNQELKKRLENSLKVSNIPEQKEEGSPLTFFEKKRVGITPSFFLKKGEGFTVIEMLISTGIVVFLTVIFLANYHSISFRTELNIDAQKVIGNFNLTRSFSLSSKKYDEKLSSGGWGVYFSSQDSSKYLIFADIDNDHAYDNGEADVAKGGKVINLSNKVYINKISVCENKSCEEKDASIIFIPPDPTVYINATSSASLYVDIKFKEKGIPTTKTIRINSLGLSETID